MRPATPAPTTTTFAGATVPAAVMRSGNIFGSRAAARRTALYPAIVAIEERASMACARVERGTSSIANAVTPASRNGRRLSGSSSGRRKPITAAPFRSRATSTGSGRFTQARRSHSARSAARFSFTAAPAAVKSASGKPASRPAPASTTTECPDATSFLTVSGARATRRSSGRISFGMETFMQAAMIQNRFRA